MHSWVNLYNQLTWGSVLWGRRHIAYQSAFFCLPLSSLFHRRRYSIRRSNLHNSYPASQCGDHWRSVARVHPAWPVPVVNKRGYWNLCRFRCRQHWIDMRVNKVVGKDYLLAWCASQKFLRGLLLWRQNHRWAGNYSVPGKVQQKTSTICANTGLRENQLVDLLFRSILVLFLDCQFL